MNIGDPVQIINPKSGFYLRCGVIEKPNSQKMFEGWKIAFTDGTGCRKGENEIRLLLGAKVRLNENIKLSTHLDLFEFIDKEGEIVGATLIDNYPFYVRILESGIHKFLKLEEFDFLENYVEPRFPDLRLINWLRC